ncbi:MAG: DUF885 family protein [Ktedonobacterales bacterium]|nr:DUF885 family protein [Ktedonobacterales bacterium]
MDASSTAPARLIAAYLDDLFAMHPYVAMKAGLHQYDGHVGDWSPMAIAARTSVLRRYEADLAPLAAEPLQPVVAPTRVALADEDLARWDARLTLRHCRHERYFWEVWRPYETNPLTCLPLLDLTTYLKRDYAPLPDRVSALIRHCTAIPAVVATARGHLHERLSYALLQQGIATYEGLAYFHTVDLVKAVEVVGDWSLTQAFHRANRAAVAAVRGFVVDLRTRLPHANEAFAYGATTLRTLLALDEAVDLPLDDLLALGTRDLARNQARIAATAAHLGTTPAAAMEALGHTHPPLGAILDETRRQVTELRTFVIDRALVTVPGTEQPLVQETLPFMRNGSAFMDVAGPFDVTDTRAYFSLTLPDPAWSHSQKEAWLAKQSIPGLANTAAHETWPGHFLQHLHLLAAPTTASKLLTSMSFVEGWAHYAEALVIEVGFHADDPHYELAQLSMALLRDCRFLAAIWLHTGQMGVDDAARFITNEAYFTPIRAQQEAMRGLRSPTYLNYTLGKLLLGELRHDLQLRYPAWSQCAVHDALLAFGAPPIPLLREVLLGSHVAD